MRRCASAVLVLFMFCAPAIAQDASELYQRGLVQEHADGHLDNAIALYTQAARASGSDRTLAARSLIRAAGCYEKLGNRTEATKKYEEVLRAYPEQPDAGVAQRRLRVLRQQTPAAITKAAAADANDTSSSTALMFDRYCVRCHNPGTRSGGLDLTSLDDHRVSDNAALWERVVRRLQARRDPPGTPRPDNDTYRAVIHRLQQSLDRGYAANGMLNDGEHADDVEMAARLANVIWGAAPDQSLRADAQRGRLRERAALTRQVVRMLRDPKSKDFVDGFFGSWLSLDRVKKARPDPLLYPQIDTDLVDAMDTETRLFLRSQLYEDRDAVEIWTANYTYVNAHLARYYGVPGVTGQDFRRVMWPDDRRAGLLGQAGILMALSTPTRTSPTARGRFVLSRFLGVDAPTPPANVPALVERATTGTLRDRLATHKVNPSCANCHAMFDPLGLALENFDAIGGWRTTDAGAPIDSTGAFVDGTRFDGPAGLRAGLLNYREAYYTNVTRRLLAYALHRKSGEVYDYEMSAVRTIVRDAARDEYRWSSLLAGIAASGPFQMKRPVP